ncbi:MAG: nucleotide exchange factor GrpE [Chlamydiales bacterium]|nr:nucleotide exchange factor GrpE [Chlamydiales bacterium]
MTEETEENLSEQLAECQAKYLRLLADSENARKRMQKERSELTQYAVENVLVDFLHPLDNFQNALKFAESMSDEVRNWAIGFEMILAQLRQVLANHGVQEYESVGKHFDPHMHEAVEMVESDDHQPGVVVEECLRGYKIGDRPIRVAKVKVAKSKNDEQGEEDERTEEE